MMKSLMGMLCCDFGAANAAFMVAPPKKDRLQKGFCEFFFGANAKTAIKKKENNNEKKSSLIVVPHFYYAQKS